jgi:hypothetical protein
MTPASFRQPFFDTVQELTDFGDDIQPGESIYWSAEYIARGTQWYHFNGCGRYGEWDAVGQAYDLQTRLLTDVDAQLMTLAFLDFQDNQLIAAYTGPKGQAAHIACGLITAESRSFPEVISVLIDRRQTVGVEVVHQTLTAFVFVGFERADDARSVSDNPCLANSKDFLSAHWYRNRVRIVPPSAEQWISVTRDA